MEITNLSFIVTDKCNYNCSYCPQKKEKTTISVETITKSVNFFYPFLSRNNRIQVGFFGGEPLLAFDKIKLAVLLLEEKKRQEKKDLEFTLTTNGSLLTNEMMLFFNEYQFAVQLSFDGLAQEAGRKKGSLTQMLLVMKQIRENPDIIFEINSVFSPQTIGYMYQSLRFIIAQGGPDITFNLSSIDHWDTGQLELLQKEIELLTDYLVLFYKKNSTIPVKNFQPSKAKPGIFRCGAGHDHMAVTPEGNVWGCFLFHDYFKTRKEDPQYQDYYFGRLGDFIRDFEVRYPLIVANYWELRQDLFRTQETDCFLCPELGECRVCPIIAAYSTGSVGKIPSQKCKLLKIEKDAREVFSNTITSQGRKG